MSEIRFDSIQNRYVIIAPEREHRPSTRRKDLLTTSKETCPFCEGHEQLTPAEIFALRDNEADTKGWKTRVVPNLYKAVQIEAEALSRREGMFEAFSGFGAHEIIIDTPCHSCTMAELDTEAVENWLWTMVVRMKDLRKDKRLVSLNIFKNSGENAGATQAHPHTQIIALPIMPEKQLEFLQRNRKYYRVHGRGIVEDVVQNERMAKERVIAQRGSFIAYCPYASFFAFEVIIAPVKVISGLDRCSEEERSELALLLKTVFKMLTHQLDRFDYNVAVMTAPLNANFETESYMEEIERNFTFYLRIMPRIYTLGGFELSTETAINSVAPEKCAKLLRGE